MIKSITLLLVVLFFSIPTWAQKDSPSSTTTPIKVSLEERLNELGNEVAKELSANQVNTVAVGEFIDDRGKVGDFGKFLSDELVSRLIKTRKFNVLDRQAVNKILTEQKIGPGDIISPPNAKKAGKALEVQSIIAGTLSDWLGKLKIYARIIGTDKGYLLGTATVVVSKNKDVCDLLGCSEQSESLAPVPPGFRRVTINGQVRMVNNPEPTKTYRYDSNFFTFELLQCRLSGNSVICDLKITNNDKDRELWFSSDSKLFDNVNSEYRTNTLSIANRSGGGISGSSYAFLISNVTTSARIEFNQVSSEATEISLLSLQFSVNGNSFQVPFRKVPLRATTAGSNSGTSSTSTGTNEKSFEIYPEQEWIDTGINVRPGMRLNITIGGVITAKLDNSAANKIVSAITKKPINVPPSTVTVGPKAVLSKIVYTMGGESNIIALSSTITLTIEHNEFGRLYLAVDKRYLEAQGHFTVNINW